MLLHLIIWCTAKFLIFSQLKRKKDETDPEQGRKKKSKKDETEVISQETENTEGALIRIPSPVSAPNIIIVRDKDDWLDGTETTRFPHQEDFSGWGTQTKEIKTPYDEAIEKTKRMNEAREETKQSLERTSALLVQKLMQNEPEEEDLGENVAVVILKKFFPFQEIIELTKNWGIVKDYTVSCKEDGYTIIGFEDASEANVVRAKAEDIFGILPLNITTLKEGECSAQARFIAFTENKKISEEDIKEYFKDGIRSAKKVASGLTINFFARIHLQKTLKRKTITIRNQLISFEDSYLNGNQELRLWFGHMNQLTVPAFRKALCTARINYESFNIIRDPETNNPKGCAWVNFKTLEDFYYAFTLGSMLFRGKWATIQLPGKNNKDK